ncbi:hypothetical protein QBC33DRAFT_543067 [Phialemonium atrogriseum]|uniref:Uncharacterized protein n=1 Tax=Phialemonium atrogriseum TaxID=1093897 RepID=A0AAJ0FK30_9PEZI|nr:uncharacterized protein QBC33DRAFT_543067 [Phialemonium atrogriseum]KAK1765973.1 hypothetical protein QBC33DRAFT_543067 [Phialemonium atrogriseum]
MMTQPENLPAFVHQLSCGFHYDQGRGWRVESCASMCTPLKPLEACSSIAHIRTSRTANPDGFLWQTIDNEHRRLRYEVSFSGGLSEPVIFRPRRRRAGRAPKYIE